jgi:hypothetical protein
MTNYLMKSLHILVMLTSLAGAEVLFAQQAASSPQTTESTLPNIRSATPTDNTALLPSLAPVPTRRITLVGGTIDAVDRVRDVFVLRTFGGGHMRILFDERTRVYLDRMTTGQRRDLQRGQRIHVDAVLDGTKVFAQSIYVLTQAPAIDSYGQVESYKASTGELIVRDSSLATTVKVQLLSGTLVHYHEGLISPTDIHPGSLISITFQPQGNGRNVALTLSVLAEAGDTVTFSGRVVSLNMRASLVVLEDPRDQKMYEIYFGAPHVQGADGLREGTNVTISTSFDGTRYVAREFTINP